MASRGSHMSHPSKQVADERVALRLEFQRVMGPRILNHLFGTGKTFDEPPGFHIVDDSIVLGQHEQCGDQDSLSRAPQIQRPPG